MFGKKDLNPHEKEAKLNVLKKIRNEMEESMKSGLGGVKKVTVSADSKKGLEKGLQKAEDLIADPESMLEDSDDDKEEVVPFEGKETPEEELEEHEMLQDELEADMDEEDLDEEIQRLLAMKSKLQSR